MNEEFIPNVRKEESPVEKEAQEQIARGLEEISAKLEKIDSTKLTPEQVKKIEGMVEDFLLCALATFVGYEALETIPRYLGPEQVKNFSEWLKYISNLTEASVKAGVFVVAVRFAVIKFLKGMIKFLELRMVCEKNSPK